MSGVRVIGGRTGNVIELRPECIDEYRRLHADDHDEIRDLLAAHHLTNFSIFLHEIAGRWFEFSYYEYVGDDREADMAALADEPRNRAWLAKTDAMQLPLPGHEGWAPMELIFFNP